MSDKRIGRTALLAAVATALLSGPPLAQAQQAACDPKTAETDISLARQVEPILEEHCIECHAAGNIQMDLNLEYGLSWFFLVNRPSIESEQLRVHPGEPDKSYLIHKLRGTHLTVGGVGERMPFEKPPLTDAQIALIAGWIKGCAPRN